MCISTGQSLDIKIKIFATSNRFMNLMRLMSRWHLTIACDLMDNRSYLGLGGFRPGRVVHIPVLRSKWWTSMLHPTPFTPPTTYTSILFLTSACRDVSHQNVRKMRKKGQIKCKSNKQFNINSYPSNPSNGLILYGWKDIPFKVSEITDKELNTYFNPIFEPTCSSINEQMPVIETRTVGKER